MANGGTKPGDAVGDKWLDTFEKHRKATDAALTRLEVRADMKSMGEEEVSSVIDQRALEVQREREESPEKAGPLVIVLTVVRKFPPWGAVLIGLAAIAAYVALQLRR